MVEPRKQSRALLKRVLAIAILVLSAVDTYRFLRSMESRKPTLKRWLPFAAELGRDDQLYDRHPDYLYPPFFLVLLRPLTHVPPPVTAVIWQLAKYVSILLIFKLCWDLLSRAGPLPVWAKVLSVILSLRFIASDLGHGNVNLFITLLMVLAVWSLAGRRQFTAGVLVAVAACIKVTPALWAVYLVYKRQWLGLAGFGVGVVLALEVVPLLLLTPQQNHALLTRWHDHVVTSFVSEGKIYSAGHNQSLAAVTNRLLGRPELAPDTPVVTLFELNDRMLKWLQRAIAVALLAVLAWSCRGRLPKADALALVAEWSLVAAVTLALSGFTWTGHFCLLIPAIVTMLAYMAQSRKQRISKPAWLLSIASFLLFVLTTDIITPAGRQWAAVVGLPLLAALLTAAALVVVREQSRNRSNVSSTGLVA